MIQLNFRPYEFQLKSDGQRKLIYDRIRKKYVVLTPEEWVRQHFIHFLILDKSYPFGLISVEKGVKVNSLDRRTDIVIYGKNGQQTAIIECKAPGVPITQRTFEQIAAYNMKYKVKYLAVSNGLNHYFCRLDHEKREIQFIVEFPSYEEIER